MTGATKDTGTEQVVILGPVVPDLGYSVIYSITLANGFVVTSPRGFGEIPVQPSPYTPRPIPAA
jgi:hypothetical protein